ncbi:FKBP-type peptidyl-prolyl cis-trans isomerase [Cellulomonas fengjieae]|uniref:FKBP-type peptidyl-prolyl cis-trans isomerase n=1 Tax=Cellulomonas fengjieae TaxID=2819978 RepID=UPI001AAE61DA|nr:FKBP-type peptidyl-prolyl cis-trans isomerase [Cellulomonas fengjieae]MBO3102948.1 FKBP-type peptidyl-prolyl cis-trans isomerase [Cellulomonas fengjieae]
MRRLQGRALVVVLAVALLSLAGCTPPPSEPAAVTVSGEPGEAPTITYLTPLHVDVTRTEQIWPGTGAELLEGAPVLIDFWLEDATDASLVKESYSTNPTAMLLTEEDLGTDLYETLRGQKVGARLLQVSPGSGSGASDYPTVTVVDVLPTRADGQPVPARPDLPAVSLDASGAPTITPTGTEPPAILVGQPLIRGNGDQVAANDVVTVQYTGFAWTTGEAFDSTWTHGLPVSFSLQDVKAWAEGLVDQPVGSQVMLVVPPDYGLGVTASEELAGQTVAFVVDILATGHPEQAGS